MKQNEKTNQLIRCPICGKLFKLGKMTWDDENRLLCKDCLNESENCGCSDEEEQH